MNDLYVVLRNNEPAFMASPNWNAEELADASVSYVAHTDDTPEQLQETLQRCPMDPELRERVLEAQRQRIAHEASEVQPQPGTSGQQDPAQPSTSRDTLEGQKLQGHDIELGLDSI